MYKLDIGELKWKNKRGPMGETCSVTIRCYVPEVKTAQVEAAYVDAVLLAQAFWQLEYSESITRLDVDSENNRVLVTFALNIEPEQLKQDLSATESGADIDQEQLVVSVQNSSEPESDADPNIFVYHAIPEDDPVLTEDEFSNVATLYDMRTTPVGEPIQRDDQPHKFSFLPFYRVDTVEMDFLTASEADIFCKQVVNRAKRLVFEYGAEGRRLEQVIEDI